MYAQEATIISISGPVPPGNTKEGDAESSLSIDAKSISLEEVEKDSKKGYQVGWSGNLKTPEWTLIENQLKLVRVDRDGKFSSSIVLNKAEQEFEYTLVSPQGDVVKQAYKVSCVECFDESFLSKKRADKKSESLEENNTGFFRAPAVVTFCLAPTSITYTQDSVEDLKQMSIRASLSSDFFPRKLKNYKVTVAGFMTPFHVSATPAGEALNYIGLNVRAMRQWTDVSPDWVFGTGGGLYYLTTQAPTINRGYENLSGVQLYGTAERSIDSLRSMDGFLKLAVVQDGISIPSVSNREIALGIAYQWKPQDSETTSKQSWYSIKSHRLGIDISSLSLNIDGVSASTQTLSLGYSIRL